MAGEAGGGLEELPSPKNKVKFLCSHAGKILPRPFDGHLKYVGGETRVIAVPRDITFSELMKKVNAPFDGEMVLKYQFIPEELDVLVSVKTDEDLKHMFDEYDRQENKGSPRLRTFLFPARPTIIENQIILHEPHALEQRYIDAVNGIIRSPRLRPSPINVAHPTTTFSLYSACSSPNSPSPDPYTLDSIHVNRYPSGRVTMQRVHSSPSLCGLNNLQQHGAQHVNQHYYNYNHHHHPHHHHFSHLSSKPPLDSHKIASVETMRRSMFSHSLSRSHCSSRHHRGGGTCDKCVHYDEFPAYGRFDRAESLPWSPRKNIWE